MIFGLSQEISFTDLRKFHLPSSCGTPRVKLHVPTEEPFPIPMKFIEVTRITDTTLDVMSDKHIDDYWNVDGERDLSYAWTGFTIFISLNEKPPDGYTWSGKSLMRKHFFLGEEED